jgi:thiol-disulfide isomerase/thioredoxin
MALTESNFFEKSKQAAHFELLDTTSDKIATLQELKGENGTVIMFICNHCPFVVHVQPELISLANDYISKGIGFIAISSNDVEDYPQDGPKYMKQLAAKMKFPFPYLYDETQEVAKAYDAACTPDFYVFDAELKSIYHGQLDNSRPGNKIAVDGSDIRNSLEKLLAKEENLSAQKPSVGCGIKWKY